MKGESFELLAISHLHNIQSSFNILESVASYAGMVLVTLKLVCANFEWKTYFYHPRENQYLLELLPAFSPFFPVHQKYIVVLLVEDSLLLTLQYIGNPTLIPPDAADICLLFYSFSILGSVFKVIFKGTSCLTITLSSYMRWKLKFLTN